MKLIFITLLALAGCVNTSDPSDDISSKTNSTSQKVSFLCVGMEYSSRFGSCAGCEKDANRLASLMRNSFGYEGDVLISEKASKSAVVKKLKAGIESTKEDGLFLFFYSGHGGQEYLGGKEPDGADAKDEYLCLYDAHLQDDEIWDIVSKCKGRVFLYFDACHSATMYRSVSSELKAKKDGAGVAVPLGVRESDMIKSTGFSLHPEKFVEAVALSGPNVGTRILCWSGCNESEYSYGSSRGGMMTLAVVNNWQKSMPYGTLWECVRSNVVRSNPGQNPVQTFVGSGFTEDMEAFR